MQTGAKSDATKTVTINPEKTEVVFGMGPGGLVAALEGAKKGCDVFLVEPREAFVRPQRLLIKKDTKDKFNGYVLDQLRRIEALMASSLNDEEKLNKLKDMVNSLSQDAIFMLEKIAYIEESPALLASANKLLVTILNTIREINEAKDLKAITAKQLKDLKSNMERACKRGAGCDTSAKTKDIQHFLRNRASQLPQIHILQPPGVEFEKGEDKNIKVELDAQRAVVTLHTKSPGSIGPLSIPFRYLVDATGNAKNIAKLLPPEQQFKEEPFSQKTRQETHFTVTLRYSDMRQVQIEPRGFHYHGREMESLDPDSLPKFAQNGWRRIGFPNFYMVPDKDKGEFYLAGELPESIIKMTDPQQKKVAIAEWGRTLLAEAYQFKDTEKMEIVEGPLAFTAFNVQLQHTQTPAVKVGKDSYVCLVGDARATPNFHYGHGVEFATADGLMFGQCIGETGSFDLAKYEQHHKQQNETIITYMATAKATRAKELKENIDVVIAKSADILKKAKELFSQPSDSQQAAMKNFAAAVEEYKQKKAANADLTQPIDALVKAYNKLIIRIGRKNAEQIFKEERMMARNLSALHSYNAASSREALTSSGYLSSPRVLSPRSSETKDSSGSKRPAAVTALGSKTMIELAAEAAASVANKDIKGAKETTPTVPPPVASITGAKPTEASKVATPTEKPTETPPGGSITGAKLAEVGPKDDKAPKSPRGKV